MVLRISKSITWVEPSAIRPPAVEPAPVQVREADSLSIFFLRKILVGNSVATLSVLVGRIYIGSSHFYATIELLLS